MGASLVIVTSTSTLVRKDVMSRVGRPASFMIVPLSVTTLPRRKVWEVLLKLTRGTLIPLTR